MTSKHIMDEDIMVHFDSMRTFWGVLEYVHDHYDILCKREKSRLPFVYQSPQIEFRKTLVDWMKKLAVVKKLNNTSIHLAVYLLDVFMDSYQISTERLHLVALVCLLLATKFEERDANILKISEINELVRNKYSTNDYFALEILVLKHVNWSLLLPTAVEFVNFYIEFLLSNKDLRHTEMSLKTIWLEAKTIAHSYLDYVIEDIRLMQTSPSLVGAAIMAITRSELGLTPLWPDQLSCITSYTITDLKLIILRLMQNPNRK
ncbi:Cyclin J [Carabus blaptoides fortunei]